MPKNTLTAAFPQHELETNPSWPGLALALGACHSQPPPPAEPVKRYGDEELAQVPKLRSLDITYTAVTDVAAWSIYSMLPASKKSPMAGHSRVCPT